MSDRGDDRSFLDHLEELRWRIVKSVIAALIFAIPSGFFWKKIFDIVMVYPLRLANPTPKLIYTSPTEVIVLSIKIALTSGIIFSTPIIFYQLWAFLSPALYKKERNFILPIVSISTLFFLMGVSFSYFTVPFVISFLAEFADEKMVAMYRAQEYLGFLIKLALAFGVVFELPVLSFVLTKVGILTPKFMIKNMRYAIVAIFIMAAVLTPPDILSQLLLALPLTLLYLISILVSFIVRRKNSD